MGIGIAIECKKCNYHKSVMLGNGMRQELLYGIADRLKGKVKEEVRTIINEHQVNDYKYELVLVRCAHCNEFFERLYVKIEYDEGQVYIVPLKCSKCKKELELVEKLESIVNYDCPQCKSKALSYYENMLWD